MLRFYVHMLLICVTLSYHHFPSNLVRKSLIINGLRQSKVDSILASDNLPTEIRNHQCINNMVLLERMAVPEKTDSGLFLPMSENKDQKHTGKVLSLPVENNNKPYQVGDYVFIKDPWGDGPLDKQVGKRYFSFQKEDHITGVIKE